MSRAVERLRGWRNDAPDARATLRMGLYAATGVVVGLVVAALEWLTVEGALHHLLDAPLWVQAAAPGAGLVAATLILRGRSTATSDEYVRVFHSGEKLGLRELFPKLAASVATLGAGGAGGLEGPSIHAGATIGQRVAARFPWLLGRGGARVLTAAGAAAGVAAIFRAPATGVLFALEAPFQRDVARRALIPALIAASTSYLTFVTIFGVDPLLPVPSGEVRFRDEVLGALLLGALAGLCARGLIWLWLGAKGIGAGLSPVIRVAVGSSMGAAAFVAARGLTGTSFTIGPATDAIVAIVLDPGNGLWLVMGVFAIRALATSATLGAGGVAGVFIPLVVQGLLLGRLVEGIFDSPTPGLFPVIGLAAVLGAAYRTPLAAVMFVAETTGRAEFVIPALLATAVSQAMMGDRSISPNQVVEREGMLERRLRLPVRDAAIEVPVLHPDTLITEVIDRFGAAAPAPALPVARDRYEGLLVLHDLAMVMFEHGPQATVADAMSDHPAVAADLPAVEAARLMAARDTAVVAVVDGDGIPLGVVTALTITGVLDYDPDA